MAVIVKYKGSMFLWYTNTKSGKARLVAADGTKYRGKPIAINLEVVRKKLVHFNLNEDQYVITKQGVFSCSTGKIMKNPDILVAADIAYTETSHVSD